MKISACHGRDSGYCAFLKLTQPVRRIRGRLLPSSAISPSLFGSLLSWLDFALALPLHRFIFSLLVWGMLPPPGCGWSLVRQCVGGKMGIVYCIASGLEGHHMKIESRPYNERK